MGYLNKICKFISRLCTIWKLNQHTTKGKNPLSTFPKNIVHYCYYDIHIFHHSNFTISNSGSIKFRTFPLYSMKPIFLYTLCSYNKYKLVFPVSFRKNWKKGSKSIFWRNRLRIQTFYAKNHPLTNKELTKKLAK